MVVRCRICLQTQNNSSMYFELDTKHTDSLANLIIKRLKYLIPGMVMNKVCKPTICISCVDTLFDAYHFKQKCLETEVRLDKYINVQGVKDPVNIDVFAKWCETYKSITQQDSKGKKSDTDDYDGKLNIKTLNRTLLNLLDDILKVNPPDQKEISGKTDCKNSGSSETIQNASILLPNDNRKNLLPELNKKDMVSLKYCTTNQVENNMSVVSGNDLLDSCTNKKQISNSSIPNTLNPDLSNVIEVTVKTEEIKLEELDLDMVNIETDDSNQPAPVNNTENENLISGLVCHLEDFSKFESDNLKAVIVHPSSLVNYESTKNKRKHTSRTSTQKTIETSAITKKTKSNTFMEKQYELETIVNCNQCHSNAVNLVKILKGLKYCKICNFYDPDDKIMHEHLSENHFDFYKCILCKIKNSHENPVRSIIKCPNCYCFFKPDTYLNHTCAYINKETNDHNYALILG